MKLFLVCFLAFVTSLALTACSSSEESITPKNLPSRQTKGDLPWGKPASWEGGLPGMGGVGNPTRY